jgi:EpsI family protein
VIDSRRLTAAALLAAAFLWTYYSTLQKLVDYWASNEMYSFGFLVPIISGYLIWVRRHHLRVLPANPSYGPGALVLASALTMLIVARASNTNVVEELSLPIAVIGTVLLVFGSRILQGLAFPLTYLFAMVPFWGFATDRLQAPFQLYSATVGVAALRLFDIPVLRDGVLIYLPQTTLEVAEVCSGINQLVAILCIGVPLAHMQIKSWSRRAIIVAAALIIAILSNGLRVAIISLFAYHGITGPNGDIHGPYSIFRTTLISGIGFLILFWLIARFSDSPSQRSSGNANPERPAPRQRVRAPAFAIAIALFATVAGFERWHVVAAVPLSQDLAAFPHVIGRWHLVSERPFSPAVDAVGFDRTVSRRYAAPDGSEVDLLVGYFTRQQEGRELVGFELSHLLSPRESSATRTLAGAIEVKDFVTTFDRASYHVTYCYLLNGRTTSESYTARWWAAWDTLTRGRNNGGIVVVRTKLGTNGSAEIARARTRDFVEGVVAAFSRYLPA